MDNNEKLLGEVKELLKKHSANPCRVTRHKLRTIENTLRIKNEKAIEVLSEYSMELKKY